ncbi:hydrogenase maturation nickel metallochaperone HypA [Hydrogenobacter hydrogenophilus]|uniref:Hydrogenase maturation factor HypA n=1 Tax=Hydrogenobacter hydrogenophilus TaxID=35835 RepID=A0A285P3J4_9AQUI|nr:hydrogenase maturation nickel metallochaperone HypA [Hydrogenobacter hydrogenophilus]SNZ15733.1 Hydrogenase-3 nickel incorporation protein HypA [Hydrogenobacter hydrogenophilus]
MHEFSVVQSLMELIEKYAEENRAKKVLKVVVSIGALSGIEPHLLELAFNTFKEGTIAESALLVIEKEKLKVKCQECGAEDEKDELNALCPFCGSLNTEIISGQEMLLKSLELECEDET